MLLHYARFWFCAHTVASSQMTWGAQMIHRELVIAAYILGLRPIQSFVDQEWNFKIVFDSQEAV